MTKRKIMVSACLLGSKCRYDGTAKPHPEVTGLDREEFELIPVCPECLGGLPIPRQPAEIENGDGARVLAGASRVRNRRGDDYTPQFCAGARQVLELYREHRPELVVLKANSPSCGVGRIYDGSFNRQLRSGDGVTAALLREHGAVLVTEQNFLTMLSKEELGSIQKYLSEKL
jgi:uncharacterized protein YbbK (DUF523 family)